MSKLKIAVIGVGNIAESHIAAYKLNPGVELYAFCDIDRAKLEEKGKIHGVTRLFTDEAEMLAALPELDAVSVCTWNNQHAPCTIMALEAGKNVLCEKPMATCEADAQKMLDTAKRTGKLLQIGFVCRYGRDCRIIEDFRDNGYFGDFYFAKALYLRRNGSPGGWFANKKYSGGGPVYDLGVHVLDITRFLMGNPKPSSVYAVTFNNIGKRDNLKEVYPYGASDPDGSGTFDVEDLAVAMVRYENGALFQLETSYNMHIKEDVYTQELYGTKGGVKMGSNVEIYSTTNDYLSNITLDCCTWEDDDSLWFNTEINSFVDCLTKGTPCRAPAEDGVEIMKILDAIYESARTGHEVIIK